MPDRPTRRPFRPVMPTEAGSFVWQNEGVDADSDDGRGAPVDGSVFARLAQVTNNRGPGTRAVA